MGPLFLSIYFFLIWIFLDTTHVNHIYDDMIVLTLIYYNCVYVDTQLIATNSFELFMSQLHEYINWHLRATKYTRVGFA